MKLRGRTKRSARAAMVALTLASTLIAGGCSKAYRTNADSQATPQSPSSPSSPASSSSARTRADVGPNDLKTGKSAQTFTAGQLTLNATYSTTLPTKYWTPSSYRPVAVTLSALDNSHSATKIYLSRATLSVTPSDGSGPIGSPITIADASNINPGYLIDFPYTYEQIFTVPAVDEGAVSLSLSFKYELLSAVSDTPKDYTKQTAISTIQVPLS